MTPHAIQRRSIACLFGIVITSFFGPLQTARAATPEQVREVPFSIESYQTDDGLPQNTVTKVFQSSEGYLWMGTLGGLVRFDGARFTVFDTANTPALKSSRVTSLVEDANDTIWIGQENGELATLRGGEFAEMNPGGAWPGGPVVASAADEFGDVWLLNQSGAVMRAQDLKVFPPPDGEAIPPVDRPSFCRLPDGRLLVVLRGDVLLVGETNLAHFALPVPAPRSVSAMCANSTGGAWVIADDHLRTLKDGDWVADFGKCPWQSGTMVTATLHTRQGILVVGTLNDGLYLFHREEGWLHISRQEGLPHAWVRTVCEDHEGNLWVGTSGGGLYALREKRVRMLNPPNGWQGCSVMGITTASDGALWAGTEGAGVFRYQNGTWRQFVGPQDLPNPFVWSVLEDEQNRIWLGASGGELLVHGPDGFTQVPGLESLRLPVTALYQAPKGDLWAGTGAGLLHYNGEEVSWLTNATGANLPAIRCIATANDGTVWFGTSSDGLGRFKDGQVRLFTTQDGLGSQSILALHVDPDGTLWIGTLDDGVNRLKNGRFSAITTENGLPSNSIGAIADDGLGYFWFSSQQGIFRVRQAELEDCADGLAQEVQCPTYGRGQGLATLACSAGIQPSWCRTRDGRLRFPTAEGVAEIDPRQVTLNLRPPPVLIEEILLDGKPTNPRPFSRPSHRLGPWRAANRPQPVGSLEVPPIRQRMELRFTGISLIAPERVRFRYKMEPLEKEWIRAGTERSAHYSYLPPGNYVFQVIASNNDGIWNQAGATLPLRVAPHLWQTWWFRIAIVAAFGGAIGGVVYLQGRRRMRTRMEDLRRAQALEHERTRIAQDIHDDLGASLTRIGMHSEAALASLNDPAAAAIDVEQIYSTARDLTRAMDEIVWAVNPVHDTLESLIDYLARTAQSLLHQTGIRCRLDVPVNIPSHVVHAEVRHNLFLAFKEAINNVIKHSEATELNFSFRVDADRYAVLVQDDGKGFDPAILEEAPDLADEARLSSGNGLWNMKQRMAQIGGQCRMESKPGRGTSVEFAIPRGASAKKPKRPKRKRPAKA